jgi:DNA-directed RNA polymerase specialized sigma24 family protein
VTFPAKRPWWDREEPRPTPGEIDEAARAFRLARGIEEDQEEWACDGVPEPEPEPEPDPVLADLYGGISRHALAAARDNLADAKIQYEQAVRQARANGWNWSEIARTLGVSRQLLHKRFRNRPED